MPKKFSFRGGIQPPHCKSQTERLATEVLPAPPVVVIPLAQHIGAPAKAVVAKGDRVLMGQLIGEAAGAVSAAVHSSVSGTVKSVGLFGHPSGRQVMSVEIENDGADEAAEFEPVMDPWREAASGELVKKIAESGIVGMGGASFPTHVKLSPPRNKPVDTLIINGAECEPYLTDDHRVMVERPEDILTGVQILKKALDAKIVWFGIEDNKPDAIQIIGGLTAGGTYNDITLAVLKSKYPQGGEKMLITAITRRKVPSGGLPMDAGCVVQNVGTALAVYDAVIKGKPLYERCVSVSGANVKSPKNLLVRIGTPVKALLDACEADAAASKKIIMGGPMMGVTLSDLSAPVIKSTSGILALDYVNEPVRRYPCVNCGICVRSCPMSLIPSRLAKFIEKENYDDAVKWNLMDCAECGSCAYMCPAKINLVQFYRLGKMKINAMRAAKKG